MRTLAAFAGLLLSLGILSLSSGHDTAATSFTPTNYLVTVTNPGTLANSNITVDFTLDSPHALAQAHASFIPSAFGVANDAAIPNGGVVGSLSISASESQSNGACSNAATLAYDLYDATTDIGNTLADTPRIPASNWPGFTVTNGLPAAVTKYPTFLKTLYPGLTPRSRAYGSLPDTIGTINRVVNVLVFEPGTALPGLSPLPASLGYIVVVVQQDPTAPAASSVINEACTAYQYIRQDNGLTENNPATAPNEGGVAYRTNPAANGSYTFMEYLRSRRDHDNDGIENQLDSCPFDSTPTWNPRSGDPVNDFDGDGIPGKDNPVVSGDQLLAGTGCDPTPLTASSDPDADGFVNRQDNCPLIANGAGQDNQADPDGDGIGNACDVVDGAADGHLHEVCVTSNVPIGSGGSPTTPSCPELVTDQDNDGFSRTVEQHIGTNHQDPCGQDAWPADLWITGGSSANDVDLQDVTSYVAPVRYYSTDVGTHPGDIRWDIAPGDEGFTYDINLHDITTVVTVRPAMLGGVKAFNGPPCPYAP